MRTSHVVHIDDTPVTLLGPRRTAYAWVCLGDAANPDTVFDLTDGRGREHPTRFHGDSQGLAQADAYVGCHPIHGDGTRHVGCRMHVPRGFHDVREHNPRAVEALAVIRTLDAVERDAAESKLSDAVLSSYRRGRAGPIVDRFTDWLAEP